MNMESSQYDESMSNAAAELFRQSLEKFGGQWRRVVTNSMYPFIGIGDWIFVETVSPADIKPGAIVVFSRRDDFVVHRVLKVDAKGSSFIEKGDDLHITDTVPFEKLIGRVSKIKKSQTVIDLNHKNMSRINRLATVRSYMHLYWYRYFHAAKIRIAESLPSFIRTPLHNQFLTLRKIINCETPFHENLWYERTEKISIGGYPVDITVVPDNRDMGLVVKIMREKNIHAVLCLFMSGITESLLVFFQTIEYYVLLFDEKGVLIECIDNSVPPRGVLVRNVRYTVLISQDVRNEIKTDNDCMLRIDGIL